MNRSLHRDPDNQPRNGISKRSFFQIVGLACVVLLAGCQADTHKSIVKQQLKILDDLVQILDSVKDKRTATVAAPKLKRIAKRMKNLKERAEKLPPPTPEQLKDMMSLQVEAMSQMSKQKKSMMDFQMRMASNPEAMAVLQEAMEDIQTNQ